MHAGESPHLPLHVYSLKADPSLVDCATEPTHAPPFSFLNVAPLAVFTSPLTTLGPETAATAATHSRERKRAIVVNVGVYRAHLATALTFFVQAALARVFYAVRALCIFFRSAVSPRPESNCCPLCTTRAPGSLYSFLALAVHVQQLLVGSAPKEAWFFLVREAITARRSDHR